MRRRARGLTLVELLIATAIFALVGVMAYAALFSVLEARDSAGRQAERLAAVQYAVSQLTDDLRQVVDRPVRAQVPLQGAPLRTPTDGRGVLTLTRGGRPNPVAQARSSLARVHWGLDEEGRLLRAVQARTDVLPGERASDRVLLAHVDDLELRFLDRAGRWHRQWPSGDTGAGAMVLPWAVEVTLVLADWGEIVRLVPLAGTAPLGPGGI